MRLDSNEYNLCDETIVNNQKWADLKAEAMEPNFKDTPKFQLLEPKDKDLVIDLIKAQSQVGKDEPLNPIMKYFLQSQVGKDESLINKDLLQTNLSIVDAKYSYEFSPNIPPEYKQK